MEPSLPPSLPQPLPPPPPLSPTLAGDPSCPCVDVSALFGEHHLATSAQASVLRAHGQEDCQAGDLLGPYISLTGLPYGQADFCYPSTYGSNGCQAYDALLKGDYACNTAEGVEPPSWCASAWCYVDMEACRRSDLSMSGSNSWEDITPFFSYRTCADDDTGDFALEYSKATTTIPYDGSGEMFRVGIPTMDYPMHFKRDATGAVVLGIEDPMYFDDSVPWEGIMIDYMDALLSVAPYAGFNYTFATPVSRLAFPGSKWTATVFDVTKHVVDMGGSDFWVTAERTAMTAFASAFSIDLHHLWVLRPTKDDSFLTVASKVFVPFSNNLWMLLLGVTIAMSFVEVYLFRDDWRKDGYDEWKEAKGLIAKMKVLFGEWGTYLGRSAMHITAGFPHEGGNSAQTIAWVGWAFLIMITIAAYTANLAAFMLQPSTGAYIKSMQEAIDANKVICVPNAVMAEIQTRYPDAFLLGMPMDALFGAAPADVWDTCDAIVWSMPLIKRDPTMGQLFCDLDVVAVEVVMETPLALATGLDLATSLSLWVQTLNSMGLPYTSFEESYYAQSCEEVPRMQALKDSTDADGRRRLRTRSRRSRRLKGGGAAAAAAGSDEEQSTATWTSLGVSGGGDLERLPASTFSGVLLVWAFFVTWAILRSVWDQHKEEGLGNASLAHVRQSMSLAEASAKHAMAHFHHASESGSEEHRRKVKKSVEVAQQTLEQTRKAFKKKAQEEGQEETRSSHEPVLVAPGDVAISKTSGDVPTDEVHGLMQSLDGRMQGMTQNFEGFEGKMAEMQGMIEKLLDAQQPSRQVLEVLSTVSRPV